MSCEKTGCELHGWAGRFQNYFKALHCPTRWRIIEIIGDDEKSTSNILEGLRDEGEQLARSSLYYHLSKLEKAGIIELAKYKEAGGGAPEKVWRLKVKEIKVDLINPPRS